MELTGSLNSEGVSCRCGNLHLLFACASLWRRSFTDPHSRDMPLSRKGPYQDTRFWSGIPTKLLELWRNACAWSKEGCAQQENSFLIARRSALSTGCWQREGSTEVLLVYEARYYW